MLKSDSYRWSILLLIVTTLIWGSTFPILKETVTVLSPTVLVSVRFLIAALTLLPFCRHFNWKLARDGTLLGVVVYLSYLTQSLGLLTISSNRAAFITSLNVILVPLTGILLGRFVSRQVAIAAGLALAGIGVMSWEGGGLDIGDLWTFGCALSYAVYILLMEKIAPQHPPLALTVFQLMAIALLGTLGALPDLQQQLPLLQAHWPSVLYLGLFATAGTTWTQAIAQRHIPATQTAILYTLEPVFASLFAFWWLGETLGTRGLIGAGMILGAMVLSQRE
ncbi:MAG: DMT family transporter [Oculatellaceae cyanobacterium Prado106]|nr:DMT family transporter [Oculatellaceae cyanobacterium Prado106]